MVQIASSIDTANISLDPPLIFKAGGTRMSKLWGNKLRSPFRLQLVRPKTEWRCLPESIHGSVVVSKPPSAAGGCHKALIDIIIHDRDIIDGIDRLEDHVIDMLAGEVSDWYPSFQNSSNDDHQSVKESLRRMLQPLLQTKVVKGSDQFVMSLELSPWGTDPPRILKAVYDVQSRHPSMITPGDVTDVSSGTRVIPIVGVVGVSMKSSTLKLVARVTDLIVCDECVK